MKMKFEKAMIQFSAKSGIICGGVAANKRLREKLEKNLMKLGMDGLRIMKMNLMTFMISLSN